MNGRYQPRFSAAPLAAFTFFSTGTAFAPTGKASLTNISTSNFVSRRILQRLRIRILASLILSKIVG
jgi:hypothetical protein